LRMESLDSARVQLIFLWLSLVCRLLERPTRSWVTLCRGRPTMVMARLAYPGACPNWPEMIDCSSAWQHQFKLYTNNWNIPFFVFFRDNILDGAVVFTLLFGSELFEDYIGHLAMATMASSEMASGDNDNPEKLQDRLKVGRHLLWIHHFSTPIRSFFFQSSLGSCDCLKNVVVDW
jgi:hypothetical protein